MVGTTPVTRKDGSVVTHVNEFRGRRETKPVLPSDHFGLFVALEPIEDA
jgi:tyrosyl-DNA phosphodiesterase 2